MIKRLIARDTRLSSFRFYDLLVHIFVVILLICREMAITDDDVFVRRTRLTAFDASVKPSAG